MPLARDRPSWGDAGWWRRCEPPAHVVHNALMHCPAKKHAKTYAPTDENRWKSKQESCASKLPDRKECSSHKFLPNVLGMFLPLKICNVSISVFCGPPGPATGLQQGVKCAITTVLFNAGQLWGCSPRKWRERRGSQNSAFSPHFAGCVRMGACLGAQARPSKLTLKCQRP